MDTSDDRFPKVPADSEQPERPSAAEIALENLKNDAATQALKKLEAERKLTSTGPVDINQMALDHLLKDRSTK